ncbi:hypothetical protein GJV11_23125 [Enterobacteriaceae bacterium RIT693]|jgi:hypothetical protein|nr:hypothetical protein [Enterobacteriaceae bacterium RIT693]
MKVLSAMTVCLVALLSGCVSPAEQASMDRTQCSNFGFTPGTDAFAQCMQKTAIHRDEMDVANRNYYASQNAATGSKKDNNKNGLSVSADINAVNAISELLSSDK